MSLPPFCRVEVAMNTLVNTKSLTRAEWLEWRNKGIGGSDVSVIAGINQFKSIFQLWLEKTGQIVTEEGGTEFTHFGTILEPIVRKEFTERTGIKVKAKNALLQSEEYPFMLANLDGVIYEAGELCIFEAKTASAYKQEIWEQGVPEEYQLQVQHYMAVTGARKTYIAALVGGNHFFYHIVYRDEELIRLIINIEKRFWEKHVVQGMEPVPDGSDATTGFLSEKYSKSNGKAVELPGDALELCIRYDELSEQLDAVKERKEAVANQLKYYLKENEIGVVGDRRVTWKQITATSFDKKRLEAENKELYDAYTTKNQYRRFKVA